MFTPSVHGELYPNQDTKQDTSGTNTHFSFKIALEVMRRNFEEWMPGHQPLYTCVGVPRLGEDDMHVEIEVEAYDPEGAKEAAAATRPWCLQGSQ